MQIRNIVERIRNAWPADATPFRIIDSNEGEEPNLLANEFKSRPAWHTLDPHFLDCAPAGYGSALSFFGHEAFRYYIAAYMKADLESSLERADPVFALTSGLTDSKRNERINPRRFGEQTWFHIKQSKLAQFDKDQVACIIDYLTFHAMHPDYPGAETDINQALANYWRPRLIELEMA
jgi:hypothetical protein